MDRGACQATVHGVAKGRDTTERHTHTHTHTQQSITQQLKNEIGSFVETWIDLEIVI